MVTDREAAKAIWRETKTCSAEHNAIDIGAVIIAAHREAAVAEEREQNDRAWSDARDSILHGRGPLAEMDVDSDIINAVLDIIDEYRPTTTPPEPRPLTAEIVKEMLPANTESGKRGFYRSEIGFIEWQESTDSRHDRTWTAFRLCLNDRHVPLESIGTDRKLAELVAALGIEVKHG